MGRKLALASKQKYPPNVVAHEGKVIQLRYKLTPKTYTQEYYLNCMAESTVTFATGPAGCGKTWLATYYALNQLLDNKVSKIVVTKPILEAGEEEIGFLPGDVNDKIGPHFQSVIDCFEDHLNPIMVKALRDKGKIEFLPTAYARGKSIKDCIFLIDESQNLTKKGIKLLLTRLGEGTQMIINGDTDQCDLPKPSDSGLDWAAKSLRGIDSNISVVEFTDRDIQRHPLITKILSALK